jgi:hypothetical protein
MTSTAEWIGWGAEAREVAAANFGDGQYDENVGGVELMVNDGSLADETAQSQIALEQRRQSAGGVARVAGVT